MRFTKGHGTENDFVVLPDPDGELDLSAAVVAAICNRRAGIGADGVLRVVLTAAVPEVAHLADQARWFMDYRNADGSVAEMCGNGVRVYARYLIAAGYASAGALRLATRDGVKTVEAAATGDIAVDMGMPRCSASAGVTVSVGARHWPGIQVDLGNPHVVVVVDDLADAGPLQEAPMVTPASAVPVGTNVEFVRDGGPGRLALRVYERGVGETRSCGTGACAAAVVAAARTGADAPASYTVDVLGGQLSVSRTATGSVVLAGPAVLVADGELRLDQLGATGGRRR